MTTYNGERFLRQQLDSLYAQTMLPDEIIVCDDGSKDGTIDILKEYRQNKGLKFYVNEKSLGVNANFYKAIKLCSSDYIAICDQDDIWLPQKIELSYKKLMEIDDGKPSVVSTKHNDIDSEGNIINEINPQTGKGDYITNLMGNGNAQGCTMMFNRPLIDIVFLIKDKQEIYRTCMYDCFIGMVAAVSGNKYNLGTPLLLYRHHDRNVIGIMKTHNISWKEKIVTYDTIFSFIPDSRISLLSTLYREDGLFFNSEQTRLLLGKIDSIEHSNSKLRKLSVVLSIKEYSLSQRIRIVMGTIGICILKRFAK